ncbi:hypothetical protein, partial [Dysosmobacter sp.]|uniref:hypothetical protein n=1 Tax=Dysosmobacter sp. TaxID=2591382 RepID=UPI002A9DC6EE
GIFGGGTGAGTGVAYLGGHPAAGGVLSRGGGKQFRSWEMFIHCVDECAKKRYRYQWWRNREEKSAKFPVDKQQKRDMIIQ